jgi:hypothetical protein
MEVAKAEEGMDRFGNGWQQWDGSDGIDQMEPKVFSSG